MTKWVALYLTYVIQCPFAGIFYPYLDHDLGAFDLQGEILEITLEDIYFISGLSRWGAPVNMEGTGRGR